MIEVLDKPKAELSEYAPKITTFNIDPEKIRDVIGTGGKVINKIIADTGVKIDISEEGSIFIATQDSEMAKKAKNIILSITEDLEAGKKYKGTVIKVLDFGAFVQIAPGKEGMIHISKLSKDRVEKVTDVVDVNDEVEVEVIKIDNRGRVDLKLINKL